MSAQFDRGIFSAEKQASSWHKWAGTGVFTDAASLLEHGYECGALPIALDADVELTTPDGIVANVTAIVATYRNHAKRVVGSVGSRYRHTTPEEFAALCTAIGDAGATPTGIFSLRDGSRVVATFLVSETNGIQTHLVIADAFDGSMRFMCGFTVVDVVCSNTLAAAFASDGDEWAKIRHTASAEEKIATLTTDTIADAIKSGQAVATLHEQATRTRLNSKQAHALIDALAPEADETASKRAKTRATNARNELLEAAALPINRRDNKPGTVATLWNAATYLVDRKADGSTRKTRGDSDMIDSLLFGSRAKRIEEIQHIVEVVMADGTTQDMTVTEATTAGVSDAQLGGGILDAMLEDAPKLN